MRRMRSFVRGLRCHLFAAQKRFTLERKRLLIRIQILSIVYGGVRFRRERAILLVDGRELFPRLLRLIRRARHTIFIQMFIWNDDDTGRALARELISAANHGVTVHIIKESLGDIFEKNKDFISTKSANDGIWKVFWNHPRIYVTYAHARDHAKVYIFDDRTIILSGMNVSDEYCYKWHDYAVELHGRRFVEEYFSGRSGQESVISVVLNTVDQKSIRPVLMRLLTSARRSIIIEHAYISDDAVLDLLAGRSHEGIRISIIIPIRPDSHHYANMRAMEKILKISSRKNLRVYMYPRMMHSKVLLTDFTTAFLGSANLMQDSLDDMGEVNVLIVGRHRRVIQRLITRLRLDVFRSQPLDAPPRTWFFQRILGWLWL